VPAVGGDIPPVSPNGRTVLVLVAHVVGRALDDCAPLQPRSTSTRAWPGLWRGARADPLDNDRRKDLRLELVS
jgi:hypothetical protein